LIAIRANPKTLSLRRATGDASASRGAAAAAMIAAGHLRENPSNRVMNCCRRHAPRSRPPHPESASRRGVGIEDATEIGTENATEIGTENVEEIATEIGIETTTEIENGPISRYAAGAIGPRCPAEVLAKV
jgi:hypothetical protein